jgi:hypothetical protein
MKRFAFQGYLVVHTHRHSGVKPFKCEVKQDLVNMAITLFSIKGREFLE